MSEFTRCDSQTHHHEKRNTCDFLRFAATMTGSMFQTVLGARSCEIHGGGFFFYLSLPLLNPKMTLTCHICGFHWLEE